MISDTYREIARFMRFSDLCTMQSVSKENRLIAKTELAWRLNTEQITLDTLGITMVWHLKAYFGEVASQVHRLNLSNFTKIEDDIKKVTKLFQNVTYLHLKGDILGGDHVLMPTLETLTIRDNWGCCLPSTNWSRLKRLDLVSCKRITELNVLEQCTSLTSLNLSYSDEIADHRPIKHCSSLKTLLLNGGWLNVKSLAFLEGCTSIECLDLTWCRKIKDYSPLKFCPLLKDLVLENCNLDSLKVIDYCSTSLKSLSISGIKGIMDLSPLEHRELETLEIAGCTQFANLDLTNFKHLTSLNMAQCTGISEFDFLTPNITDLNLSLCTVSESSFLHKMTALTNLGFPREKPSSFEFFQYMSKLESLSLVGFLGTIDFLHLIPSLKHLNCYGRIWDAKILDQCPKLESLLIDQDQASILRTLADKGIQIKSL